MESDVLTTETAPLRDLIHNPADIAAATAQWAEHILTTAGVPFGVACIDEKMNPMHPGDVAVICGRPGHGKTSLLATLARAEARRIVERKTVLTEAVFYITWEQVAEEINLLLDANNSFTGSDIMRGTVTMDQIHAQARKRVLLPIWIIGDSISKSSTKTPRMFPDVIFDAIELAVDTYNVKPTLLLFDYIQIVPVRNVSEKIMQVSLAAELVKELAKRIGCPAVIGAQAHRRVDDREYKVPQLQDAYWSSSIEQVTDKFFGIWRPWLTDKDKEPITIGTKSYPITEELFVLQMCKQRFGEAGMNWGLHFRPEHLRLCELELQKERWQ